MLFREDPALVMADEFAKYEDMSTQDMLLADEDEREAYEAMQDKLAEEMFG